MHDKFRYKYAVKYVPHPVKPETTLSDGANTPSPKEPFTPTPDDTGNTPSESDAKIKSLKDTLLVVSVSCMVLIFLLFVFAVSFANALHKQEMTNTELTAQVTGLKQQLEDAHGYSDRRETLDDIRNDLDLMQDDLKMIEGKLDILLYSSAGCD